MVITLPTISALNTNSVLNSNSVLNTSMTCTLDIFTHRFTDRDEVKPYKIYGVTIGEVEVDLLTGKHQVSCLWTLLLYVKVEFIAMC